MVWGTQKCFGVLSHALGCPDGSWGEDAARAVFAQSYASCVRDLQGVLLGRPCFPARVLRRWGVNKSQSSRWHCLNKAINASVLPQHHPTDRPCLLCIKAAFSPDVVLIFFTISCKLWTKKITVVKPRPH